MTEDNRLAAGTLFCLNPLFKHKIPTASGRSSKRPDKLTIRNTAYSFINLKISNKEMDISKLLLVGKKIKN